MLILTRREGETITIGDDIEVTILSQNGYQTKVGITAPQGAGTPEGCIRTGQGGGDRTLNTNPATVPGF